MQKLERVTLKVSGELFGQNGDHISFEKFDIVARQLIDIRRETQVQMAVVVGGGNIFRGRQADSKVDPTEADSMGMLATVMNGIGLREALVRNGAEDTRLMTAFPLPSFAEPYIRQKGRHHLSEGRIVVLSGGTGQPGCSTDTAVAQYAWELQSDLILKASTVNGVYDHDPRKNPQAKRYERVSFQEVLDKRLGVMDMTAFTKCSEWGIPIFVFDIADLDELPRVIKNGDFSFGTLVTRDEKGM